MVALLFDIAAERLERCTALDRLEVRGTLRIALKRAGLDPNNLTVEQLRAVFEQLMPVELENRGVVDAVEACGTAMDEIACVVRESGSTSAPTPDDIFKRLGGG